MDKKLQQEYVEKMKECVENGDTEVAHCDADDLLCEFLRKLNYNKLVGKYLEIKRWFA